MVCCLGIYLIFLELLDWEDVQIREMGDWVFKYYLDSDLEYWSWFDSDLE